MSKAVFTLAICIADIPVKAAMVLNVYVLYTLGDVTHIEITLLVSNIPMFRKDNIFKKMFKLLIGN
jgi:hypothetical protein